MRHPYVLYPFILILLAMNGWMLYLIYVPQPKLLEVHFLDVGQGDAILIETPGGVDVLIDGGPDRSVLRKLPKKLGLFDRHIDVVIASHPDKDHIAGLTDTLKKYDVDHYLESTAVNDSPFSQALDAAVAREKGIKTHTVVRGTRITLGDGAYADVLFPDRDVSKVESNDGSIALRLVYGDTSFLFAGDMSTKIEDYIVTLEGSALATDVLKVSHHGSRHSTSALWLEAVDPSLAVVSAGKGNSYGHPTPAVVERVRASGARLLSTIEEGTITLVSDGSSIEFK